METLQSRIESLLHELVADGSELGIQVAVYHRGRLVVDASDGVMSPAPDARPVSLKWVWHVVHPD